MYRYINQQQPHQPQGIPGSGDRNNKKEDGEGDKADGIDARFVELQLSCLLNLSACSLACKHHGDAYSFAEEVLKVDKDHPKALFRRGCAALAMGDPEQAVKDLSRAHELQKQDSLVARKLVEAKKAAQAEKARNRRALAALFQDDNQNESAQGGGGGGGGVSSSQMYVHRHETSCGAIYSVGEQRAAHVITKKYN